MKLKFLMPYHRENSLRDKVIGRMWIYLEKNTLHRESVWAISKGERAPGYEVVSFYKGGPFHKLMSGRSILGNSGKFLGKG